MCQLRVCCSVYGLEFFGDSWKHNVIFIWHVWIFLSCLLIMLGLNLINSLQSTCQKTAGTLCGFGDIACCRKPNVGLQSIVARLWLNAVGVLYFNGLKLTNLALGLCDVEYMAEHFKEFGVIL